jgi:hypothetical protein
MSFITPNVLAQARGGNIAGQSALSCLAALAGAFC